MTSEFVRAVIDRMARRAWPRATWLAIGAILALGACASTPRTQYHTLIAPAASTRPLDAGFALEVVPIAVPEQVDRPQLVVRVGGDAAIRVLEQQQWAAPLQNELRDALSLAMSTRLAARDVYNIEHPPLPVYRVAVTVQRFEAMIDGTSTLAAVWSVRNLRSDALLLCQNTLQYSEGVDLPSMVRGLQLMVGRLAGMIATVVRAFAESRVAVCPGSGSGNP